MTTLPGQPGQRMSTRPTDVNGFCLEDVVGGKGLSMFAVKFLMTSSMLKNLEEGEKAKHEEVIKFLYLLETA